MTEAKNLLNNTVWTEELGNLSEGKFVKFQPEIRRTFELLDIKRVEANKPEFGDAEGKQFVLELKDLETNELKTWTTTSKKALNSLKNADVDKGDHFEITKHGDSGANYEVLLLEKADSLKKRLENPTTSAQNEANVSEIPF